MRTVRQFTHKIADLAGRITVVCRSEIFVEDVNLLGVVIHDHHQVMSDTCACGIDTIPVVQVRKETRSGVCFTAVLESFVIEIDLHLGTYCVRTQNISRSTDYELLIMSHGFYLILLIIAYSVIDDAAVAVVITDIFGHHEGVGKLSCFHSCRAREERTGVVVVFQLLRLFALFGIVVTRGDDLHLVVDSDIHLAVEIRCRQVVLVDDASLHLLHAQRMQGIDIGHGLYVVVRRVIEPHSGVAEEDVRHLVLVVAQRVLAGRDGFA